MTLKDSDSTGKSLLIAGIIILLFVVAMIAATAQ